MTTVVDRVGQLLESVLAEERLRHRSVEEAARFLDESPATLYRRIKAGEIGHIKLEGEARKGHGRAGTVKLRLIDLIEFSVRNERAAGTAK